MSDISDFGDKFPLLSTLLQQSQEEQFCFVETHTNEIIPIKDCTTEQVETELYVKGFDYINERYHVFPASNIKIVTTTTSTNTFLRIQKENFAKVIEMCRAENIPINPDLLYKDLPVYQKIISLVMNTKYEEISLVELKELWKKYIENYCSKFENYILLELDGNTNELYRKELLLIQSQLVDLRQYKEVKLFKTKEDLVKFWPTLLMPAPSFVNI